MEAKNTVPMLEKALDIMEYISISNSPVGLPELQRNLGIAQASCYRIVATLVRRSWLEKRADNRYEIASGVVNVADKIKFRLEKYRNLQPVLNLLANHTGFSVKFTVLDGDEFVNVCSAQCRSGQFSISEPGSRCKLNNIASVSTVFLSEMAEKEIRRVLDKDLWEKHAVLQQDYLQKGYSFIPGEPAKNSAHPFDTLSFPVKDKNNIYGVLSFLGMPFSMENECERIAGRIKRTIRVIINTL